MQVVLGERTPTADLLQSEPRKAHSSVSLLFVYCSTLNLPPLSQFWKTIAVQLSSN